MPNSLRICVDASVVVRLLGSGQYPGILDTWNTWMTSGMSVCAPPLLKYEVVNAVYQAVKRQTLHESDARIIIESLLALPISYVEDEMMHIRALHLATRFSIHAAYDAHYLAVAEHLGADFWTADKRLHNATSAHLDFIHLVE